SGEVMRIIGVTEDTTQRVETESQLRRAQRLEAIGQLTGGVAHDFNNLLAVIMGNCELLALEAPEHDALIAPIMSSTRKGADLTRRLLSFARQQHLRPQPVDLAAHLQDMQPLLARTLGETIDIAIVIDEAPQVAMVDPSQFDNAILNLAINARDAMLNGGCLKISCGRTTAPTGEAQHIIVGVCDTGSGMTDEIRQRAFEPFFTTKDVGKGSGMGLSMVFGFAKQSGGDVTIKSTFGQGTTVHLHLPAAPDAVHRPLDATPTEVPKANGENVLLVEDDDQVRRLSETMLTALGYRVTASANAIEARRLLNGPHTYDAVLCDLILPGGVSGAALAHEIRARHATLPVVLMSAYPAEEIRKQEGLLPEEFILDKPFRQQDLARVLRDRLAAANA
ncbi:MAG: ATP-binding protein, partial [Pseudomonadota bacterium]